MEENARAAKRIKVMARTHKRKQLERKRDRTKRLQRETCARLMSALGDDDTRDLGSRLCMPLRAADGTLVPRIDWETVMPKALDPTRWHDGLNVCRGQRKRWQIESMLRAVEPVLRTLQREKRRKHLKIVDFGSGSGNFGLCCAFLFPECSVVLVDMNRVSIELAKKRAEKSGLKNLQVVHGRIEEFSQPFDLCVSLHACGNASDFAQALSIHWNAAYVMAPCCIGKLKHSFKLLDGFGRAARDDSAMSSSKESVDTDLVAFYDKLSRNQLVHLLALNGVTQSARKKLEIARRCAHMDAHGVPAKCPKCNRGRMKCGKDGKWSCLGRTYCMKRKRLIYCGYKAAGDVPLLNWVLPVELEKQRKRVAVVRWSSSSAAAAATAVKIDGSVQAGVAQHVCSKLSHPRSKWCRSKCTVDEFVALSNGADHHIADDNDCKFLIECDRSMAACESGFFTVMGSMYPKACTNKRHILVGVPASMRKTLTAIVPSACEASVDSSARSRECLAFVRDSAVRGPVPEDGRCVAFLPNTWRYCGRRASLLIRGVCLPVEEANGGVFCDLHRDV